MLRQRLASVRGKVEDVIEEQHIAREIAVHEIYPIIMGQISDIDSVNKMFSEGLHSRQSTSTQDVAATGKISFPNSSATRFMLRARMLWYQASMFETGDFKKELEEIQVLLHEEMRKLGASPEAT